MSVIRIILKKGLIAIIRKEEQPGPHAGYPVKLIYKEQFSYEREAMYREAQIKKWSHKKKEALVTGNLKKLKTLSKRRNSKQLVKTKGKNERSLTWQVKENAP